MKLLKAALEKQDYNLAAHVLVYGLVKASRGFQDTYLKNAGRFPKAKNYHGKNSGKGQQPKK